MRKISRFVHTFDLGDHVALWHSLRMKPVFLEKHVFEELRAGKCSEDLECELVDKRIFLSSEDDDDRIIAKLRAQAPRPDVNLAYFILSEHCNLACAYCFVGSDACGRGISKHKDMTVPVADRALDVFARQLEESKTDYMNSESNIIFFGGEPLLQFDVLIHVARRVRSLSEQRPVLQNTNLAVITNGTLLDEERILALDALGVAVSISIDGFTEQANSMRVDKAGKGTFDRVVQVLEAYKRLGVEPPSLSVTLTERTIEDLPSMVRLLKEYDIKGFGYNVLLKQEEERGRDEYYEAASQFIIDSFLVLRECGVYEDRIMRKLNAFARSRVHFSDCGATSGGQILFAPDGRIGICQGLMADEENYAADIWDEGFIANEHPLWHKWASLTAIHDDGCLSCEALGVCGGGCPVNARMANPEMGLHARDERSCIHSKRTLEFLIRDLYNLAKS